MAGRIRRRTTCPVPGHGTRCEPSRERAKYDYYRSTEERLAMEFELLANEGRN